MCEECGQRGLRCNNIILMSLRRLLGMDRGVTDLQLQIKPRAIILAESSTTPWVLYLEKGMQVIGRFATDDQAAKESTFKFRSCSAATFRLNNLSNGNYSWRLYRISATNGQQMLEDSTSFNVKMSVELYDLELTQRQKQIQPTLKEKGILQKNMVMETWKTMRMQLKNRKCPLKCIFHNKANLQFILEIKNPLDLEIQKVREDQFLRESMRRKRSLERESTDPDHTIKIQIAGEGKERHYEVQVDETEINKQYVPNKKFSLLSDIIEQSVEVSSSYGYPEHTTPYLEHSHNNFDDPLLIIKNSAEEPQRAGTLQSGKQGAILKGRTMQDRGKPLHFLSVSDRFRRAQTAEKPQQEDETSQHLDSSFDMGEVREVGQPGKTMGPRWGRWAWIVVSLVVGLVLLGQLQWQGAGKKKVRSKKVKAK